MKYFFIALVLWSSTWAYAQTHNVAGVYEITGKGVQQGYLLLECDYTYHFLSFYELKPQHELKPGLKEKKKWHVENGKVILESPVYGIASFVIKPDGTLQSKTKKDTITWLKIVTYDNNCSILTYTQTHSPTSYTLIRFSPDLVITSSERFTKGKLEERITFHQLTTAELDTIHGFQSLRPLDSFTTLRARVAHYQLHWPAEKVEVWDKDKVTVSYYDKKNKLIRRE